MNGLLSLISAWRSLLSTAPVWCRDCADEKALTLPYPPSRVSATGTCGNCGAQTLVMDPALLRHYRAQGLDLNTIHSHLPLLRHSQTGERQGTGKTLTWQQIDRLIAALPSPEEPR